MSLHARLDRRLQARAEGTGPVRRTLSTPRLATIWLAADLVVTRLLTGTLSVPGGISIERARHEAEPSRHLAAPSEREPALDSGR